MDKSSSYSKIITKSTFESNNDNKDNNKRILNLVVDMLKNANK